jgi:hypothetical protein
MALNDFFSDRTRFRKGPPLKPRHSPDPSHDQILPESLNADSEGEYCVGRGDLSLVVVHAIVRSHCNH